MIARFMIYWRNRLVRNGHLPGREVTSGIGPVTVSVPRVKDRKKVSSNDEKIRFSSNIVEWLYFDGHINSSILDIIEEENKCHEQ